MLRVEEPTRLRPYIKGSPMKVRSPPAKLPKHPAALSKETRRASFVEPSTRNYGRKVGIPLATVAIVALSCDALLIKMAGDAGASPAVVIIVKYGASTVVMSLIIATMHGIDRWYPQQSGPLLEKPTPRGWYYMGYAVLLGALESICYTLGFTYTTSANVLAFAALGPMWSAIMTWLYLSIIVPLRTRIAVGIALLGCGVVAYGVRNEFGADGTVESVMGILCAIAAGIVGAANFTVYQAASITAPNAPMMVAEMFGGFLSFAIGWAFLLNLHPPGEPLMPEDPMALVWLFLSGLSSFFDALVVIACLLVSGTELALLMQIEAFISPLLTFLVLAEIPSLYTIVGGLVIITVVGANEVAAAAYPDERVEKRIQHLTMIGLQEYMDPTIEPQALSMRISMRMLPVPADLVVEETDSMDSESESSRVDVEAWAAVKPSGGKPGAGGSGKPGSDQRRGAAKGDDTGGAGHTLAWLFPALGRSSAS